MTSYGRGRAKGSRPATLTLDQAAPRRVAVERQDLTNSRSDLTIFGRFSRRWASPRLGPFRQTQTTKQAAKCSSEVDVAKIGQRGAGHKLHDDSQPGDRVDRILQVPEPVVHRAIMLH